MTRISSPAIDALDSRASALATKQDSTRREDVSGLVPAAEALVREAQAEVARDTVVATDASSSFSKYGWAQRVLHTGQAQAFRVNVLRPARGRLAAAKAALDHAKRVRDSITTEAQPVEVRTAFSSGICGVYNERTGKVEWKTMIDSGVAGAYNPATGSVKWVMQIDGGAAVVRTPSGAIVPRTAIGAGVAGYVDPKTGGAKFISQFDSGVAAIVDGNGELHKTTAFGSGIAAYIDPATGEAKFTPRYFDRGVAVVYRDGNTYRSSCGFSPQDDDK